MNYKLHTAVFESGERFPVLLHAGTFQPVILTTRYCVDRHRDTKAVSTLERQVRVLGWFLKWADENNLYLEERLRRGELLSPNEITGLCRYLRAKRNSVVVGSINPQGEEFYEILSPQTFNSYVGIIEEFLIWAAYAFIPRNAPTDRIRQDVEVAKEHVQKVFESQRIGGKSVPRLGLTAEEITELREVIKPGSKRNPFQRSVQFRNYVIVEFMLATGVRRGELLSLKLKHLPIGPKTTVTIEKSPDDRDDPRKNAPQVKTLGREIPLPREMIVRLNKYTQSFRKKGRHPYVFTSNRGGSPLNYGGVHWIYSTLVEKCFPHLKGRLSPHIMRHTFNDGLWKEAIENKWDDQKRRNVQTYLNGWAENSHMPEVYTRRQAAAMGMELAELYQRSLYADEERVF